MNIIYKYRDEYVSIDRERMNMVASRSKDRATLTSILLCMCKSQDDIYLKLINLLPN